MTTIPASSLRLFVLLAFVSSLVFLVAGLPAFGAFFGVLALSTAWFGLAMPAICLSGRISALARADGPPSGWAILRAKKIVRTMLDRGMYPIDFLSSAEGGVVIVCENSVGRYASFEVFDDGELLASAMRGAASDVFEVEDSDKSVGEAVDRLADFVSGGRDR
jgi:hypothetical protein